VLRKLFTVIFIIQLILASGCTTLSETQSTTDSTTNISTISSASAFTGSAPSPSLYIDIAFTDGAPPLNQIKELVCTINAPNTKIDVSVNLKVKLPEALELVSGQASWEGTIPAASSLVALKIQVKAVKTGSWIISAPYEAKPDSYGSGGKPEIYISISDNLTLPPKTVSR